ncbi:hypothetical protein CRI77_07925 [Mycolicibacterium duvalii]|nr:DUF4333 domain-containing protein [Mycolicibacterium duvalii]PEG42615.1 hypothetical protein CRI77_07925 [Mycolicibacterium duvalii]
MLVTACSFSFSAGGPDYDKLESGIADKLDDTYAQISRSTSGVTCPRSQPRPSAGDTFLCHAELDGEQVRVEVTVEDDDGNVRFDTLDIVFDMAKTAALLDADIEEQVGFPVTVQCGDGLKVVPRGGAFTCTAVDRKFVEKTVQVAVDSDGNDNWQIVD